MVSACVVFTVKHGGGSTMMWRCFAYVSDLLETEDTFNWDLLYRILQWQAIWFVVSGSSFNFQSGNDPKHTYRLCKIDLEEGEGWIRWTGLSKHPTWTQLSEKQPTKDNKSTHGNSLKIVRKAFWVITSWGCPGECQKACKAPIKVSVLWRIRLLSRFCFVVIS